jgi:hypothetical protein
MSDTATRKYKADTVTLDDLVLAVRTVQRMNGASPAWKRANRLARTYATQNNITITAAIRAAQEESK